MTKNKKGFTLIELLIVIGIIGFLAAAILVAVDPVKRIQDARNAKRWAEINGILNAVLTKQVDSMTTYNGVTGATITGSGATQVIVSSQTGVTCTATATAPACPATYKPSAITYAAAHDCIADLSDLVTGSPSYLAAIDIDPLGSGTTPTASYLPLGTNNTGYYISRSSSGRIEIGACYPDQSATVSVKR